MHPRFAGMDLSDGDRRVLSNVDTHGWHVVLVPAEQDDPGWAFTVGLEESFGQPECCVFGLPQETAHLLLNDLGARAKSGAVLAPDERDESLLRGLGCARREVLSKWYPPFFGTATWFYGAERYRMLQVFWPDRANRLPWVEGFDPEFEGIQPFLGVDPLPPNRLDRWIADGSAF